VEDACLIEGLGVRPAVLVGDVERVIRVENLVSVHDIVVIRVILEDLLVPDGYVRRDVGVIHVRREGPPISNGFARFNPYKVVHLVDKVRVKDGWFRVQAFRVRVYMNTS